MQRQRYYALDLLRGLSLLLMVCHHFGYNLVSFGLVGPGLIDNIALDILQPFFASCFIAMSGASSKFSRNNVKRGLKICAAALAVSAFTYGFGKFSGLNMFIGFGILHFLGVSTLIYTAVQPVLSKIRIHGVVWLVAFFAAFSVFPITSNITWLWPIGVYYPGFSSADYFPLLPWIFMYFFGAWLADPIKDGKMPDFFYKMRCAPLEWVSRHSLWVYLLHQPLIYGGMYLIFSIL